MARDQKDLVENANSEQQASATTRRTFSKKAAWVAPTVLAVIAASQRPALAASSQVPQ